MASMSQVRTASRAVLAQTLHINVQPAPTTLHDRRGILRVLKSFGDVVYFKWLGNEPKPAMNTILAVFQKQESTQKLLEQVPLRLTVEPPSEPGPNTSLATLEILHERSKIDEEREQLGGGSQRHEQPLKEFHLRADAGKTHIAPRIQRHHFHGPFSPQNGTFSQEDLARNVPMQGLSLLLANSTEIPQRIARRNFEKAASRESLRELWERRIQTPPPASSEGLVDESHQQ